MADDDTIGLNEVDAVLRRHQVNGDDIAARVGELYLTDPHAAMEALIPLAEVQDDTLVCDFVEAPEPENDEEDDEVTRAARPAWR